MSIHWIINMAGLIISGWGTWQLFKGTPLDTVGYSSGINTEPIFQEEREQSILNFKKRANDSRNGFKLLMIGFIVQMLAQIIQVFVYKKG
ncbi:hypothetical protein D3C77_662700 [compost metagenome]